MRTCLRCAQEMLEDYTVGISSVWAGVANVHIFSEASAFKGKNLGKINVAVCPMCGYTELFTDNLKKINQSRDVD